MKQIGLMGRVGVSFCVSTLLPILLMYLSAREITTISMNVGILMLAGVFLVGWIYMGIVRPVDELKAAAKRIESGDLDFTLEAETNDEFGELMQAFEQMRIRLKETQEEKIRNDTENKELISNIAHDLKTPLTAIKGYSEGILDGIARSPEKQLKYIQTIYNKANDMNRLIDELNYYAKIETNRIPYDFQHINVGEYFADCADEIGVDMESRGFTFEYKNEVEDGVEMIADPEQLNKVINNIISNSVKYMDKTPGRISIHVEDAGDYIQVNIGDNGKGIAPKDIPYIFERFYRADSSRNSMTGGSGIGLSIVKKIIEDHGGRIWASSKEGEGTTIHFVLRKYIHRVIS
ncbi:MAG: HAMP domain-containing sensor histidine kinase [Oribacterium sp.]|nr:HAMP domain-containing sensor histidine kinase [Oribacterium sp.]